MNTWLAVGVVVGAGLAISGADEKEHYPKGTGHRPLDSDRAMLEMLAQGYDRAGMPEPAAEARAAALEPMTPRESWQAFARMGSALGTARRLDLYAHSLAPGYFFQWMRDSGLPEENWLRGSGPSQATLWRDDRVFESLAHAEEPDRFADVVRRFVRSQP